MRRVVILICGVVGLLAMSTVAHAHGDLRGTSPEAGSTLRKAPKRVTITLTEAPTKGADARAVDGCKDRVPAAVSVSANDIVLTLEGGRPGRWKVSYRAVSRVDGHQTKGILGFKVAGKKDCSAPEEEDQVEAPGNPGIVDNPDPPDEGGTSWLLWVLGGTVVLVGGAFLVRRSTQ